MKVYHGSYAEIKHIDLSKCKPNKDFGKGFYVTKFRHHAEAWARTIGGKHNTKGFVTEFDYTDSDFSTSICKIKRFDGYNEEWLDFVVMNRDKKGASPAHNYDIVEGPVANDKVQITLRTYLKGKIPKAKFLKMLAHHEETHQICFCTLNSLQLLDGTGNLGEIHYEISNIGDQILERLMIDNDIDESQASNLFYNSKTFMQLTEDGSELYRQPWRKIYTMLKQELGMAKPVRPTQKRKRS